MSSKIKVGLIGAGRIGKIHGENVATLMKNAELTAVSDVSFENITKWATDLGVSKIHENYMEILKDPTIDAVLICSPSNTHAEISMEAARHGKHIFCEKPIDHDVERIKRTIEVVEKANVKYQVGFNRRFDHNFMKVREAIAKKTIGDLHILKITSRDPEPPPISYVKVSHGMFFDMTIHDFDMARYLSGSDVTEVYVNAGVMVDPAIGAEGDVDTALISLKFASGSIGVIDNSRKAAYGYDQRVEAFGSLGCASVSNDTDTTLTLSTSNGIIGEKPLYFFLERYKDSFIREVRDFLNAIENNTPTPLGIIDGLKPVLIAQAAQESHRTGQPIRVKDF